jgi:hypothetical protein
MRREQHRRDHTIRRPPQEVPDEGAADAWGKPGPVFLGMTGESGDLIRGPRDQWSGFVPLFGSPPLPGLLLFF